MTPFAYVLFYCAWALLCVCAAIDTMTIQQVVRGARRVGGWLTSRWAL